MDNNKPRKLNGEIAAKWLTQGELKLYAYFEHEGEIREHQFPSFVILNFDAQLDLTDMICQRLGGCDRLKDCKGTLQDLAEIEDDPNDAYWCPTCDRMAWPNDQCWDNGDADPLHALEWAHLCPYCGDDMYPRNELDISVKEKYQ